MNRLQAVDSGFSDFAVRLITDTFDALISSSATQAERLAEIDALLALPPEEFQSRHVTEQMIDDRLIELFGAANGSTETTTVAPGQPYRRATGRMPESPAVTRHAGFTPSGDDLLRKGRSFIFTETGSQRVRDAIATRLAAQAITRLAAIRKHGVSRVEVERGKINVKLVMKLSSRDATGSSAEKPPVDIRVAPVSLSNPAILRAKTAVSAELEIHFKTQQ